MSNQSTNPITKFLLEKGFQIKVVNSTHSIVSLSTRRLDKTEVQSALGLNFIDWYTGQNGDVVHIFYSDTLYTEG